MAMSKFSSVLAWLRFKLPTETISSKSLMALMLELLEFCSKQARTGLKHFWSGVMIQVRATQMLQVLLAMFSFVLVALISQVSHKSVLNAWCKSTTSMSSSITLGYGEQITTKLVGSPTVETTSKTVFKSMQTMSKRTVFSQNTLLEISLSGTEIMAKYISTSLNFHTMLLPITLLTLVM